MLTPYHSAPPTAVTSIETLDDSSATECHTVSNNPLSPAYKVQYLAANIGIGTVGLNRLHTGIANKLGNGPMRVYFTQPFKIPPIVFLSPWFDDCNSPVTGVDTVINVTSSYFDMVSSNAGTKYFTNWMAYGQ
jgi:hypothetical protein